MKPGLNVSAASKIVTMACCPKGNLDNCGIAYRHP